MTSASPETKGWYSARYTALLDKCYKNYLKCELWGWEQRGGESQEKV